MKRPCLDYAKIPDHCEKGTLEDLLASIAWLGDNEGYGIQDACKRTIDKARALFEKPLSDTECRRIARDVIYEDLQKHGIHFYDSPPPLLIKTANVTLNLGKTPEFVFIELVQKLLATE